MYSYSPDVYGVVRPGWCTFTRRFHASCTYVRSPRVFVFPLSSYACGTAGFEPVPSGSRLVSSFVHQ